MRKIKLGPDTILFPMPAALVGGKGKDGRVSFATIAWAGIVNSNPPMIQVSIRKSRFTHELISETGEFSVNIPSANQARETDFCGIVSGRNTDKVRKCGFTLFYGVLRNAPLITECPVNIECKTEQVVELPSHDCFIGKVVEVHMNEELKIDGQVENAKINPLVFMGTHYARATGNLGRAFSIGREIK